MYNLYSLCIIWLGGFPSFLFHHWNLEFLLTCRKLKISFSSSRKRNSKFCIALLSLLLYVDDIIVTGSSPAEVSKLIATLAARFSLKDLGCLNYFLGVEVIPSTAGIFLSQRKYITDLLHKSGMAGTKLASTPLSAMDTQRFRWSSTVPNWVSSARWKPPILEPYSPKHCLHHKQTRPIHAEPQNGALDCTQKSSQNLAGSRDKDVFISTTSPLNLHVYSDVDWEGDNDDYISTTDYLLYHGSTTISWSSRKQHFFARSSTKAEYKALADMTSELLWVLSLFTELGHTPTATPVIYWYNLDATHPSANPLFHSRMKHIALANHFVRENVQHDKFRVSFVSTDDQLDDILTVASFFGDQGYLISFWLTKLFHDFEKFI